MPTIARINSLITRRDPSPHVNPYAQPGDWAWESWHVFDNEADFDESKTSGDFDSSKKSVWERLNEIIWRAASDATVSPCKKCGGRIRWRDCYNAASMHCEKCSPPPSLAMVKAIFGLMERANEAGGNERGWLELTDEIMPLWRERELNKRRAKTASQNREKDF